MRSLLTRISTRMLSSTPSSRHHSSSSWGTSLWLWITWSMPRALLRQRTSFFKSWRSSNLLETLPTSPSPLSRFLPILMKQFLCCRLLQSLTPHLPAPLLLSQQVRVKLRSPRCSISGRLAEVTQMISCMTITWNSTRESKTRP
jgi:hypothetical protein